MNTGDIYSFINTFAPFDTAEKWDNVGLLVGNSDNLITKVLISLDITPAVVFEAYEKGAEPVSYTHLDVYKRQGLIVLPKLQSSRVLL